MSRGIASTTLLGNLTRDVELRAVGSDNHVATLSVAVNLPKKVGGEWTEQAHYLDVKVWGRQAENAAKYLSKGSQVAVSGHLEQETWEAQDGSKRSKIVVVAENVVFLGGKQEQAPKDDTDGVPW